MRFLHFLPVAAALATLGVGCQSNWEPNGPSGGTPEPEGPPVIQSFRVGSSSLDHGQWTTLTWQIQGAEVASISGMGGLSGADLRSGLRSLRPHETISYTLTASNDDGTVEATTTVEVTYPAAIYVSSQNGDDEAAGDAPATALATIDAALERTRGGGFIFVANGFYQTSILIDAVDVKITGGLNPDTFFEEPDGPNRTTVQPISGVPLTVRDTGGFQIVMTDLDFDTGGAGIGELAGLVDGAMNVTFVGCTFDGRRSSEATGLRVLGDSHVDAIRCKIFGGNPLGLPSLEARALEIRDASSALISHCFIDGGRAETVCSGVELATSGTVRIGLCSIAAEITSVGGAGASAAAIRIHQGNPLIGGNLLFARGGGRRFGVAEEAAGTDPRALEHNMFISLATPPYDNFRENSDPLNEDDLNNGQMILEANPNEAHGNILVTDVAARDLFVPGAIEVGDFHLVSRIESTGELNPARDRGGARLTSRDYHLDKNFGLQDIDDENRPGFANLWDLGADEL
jgi:hypothetical protein